MTMKPHEERVCQEKMETDARLSRLIHFIYSEKFPELPGDEQMRLHRQRLIMELYSQVLQERISAFPA